MRELNTKVALVTGAASGIGRSTALALAKKGANLVLCDVDRASLESLETEINSITHCLLSKVVDVADREQVRKFADEVHAKCESIDILVNNAGVGLAGGILETSLEDWDWILGVNLNGVIYASHFFIPNMVKKNKGGHVVNISSVYGMLGAANVIGYVTTKFGVFGFSESLREELRAHKIGVSVVCPGLISTNIAKNGRFPQFAQSGLKAKKSEVEAFFDAKGASPEKVAQSIVKGIVKNQAVVLVTPEAWGVYYAKRLSPSIVPTLNRIADRILYKSN